MTCLMDNVLANLLLENHRQEMRLEYVLHVKTDIMDLRYVLQSF